MHGSCGCVLYRGTKNCHKMVLTRQEAAAMHRACGPYAQCFSESALTMTLGQVKHRSALFTLAFAHLALEKYVVRDMQHVNR